MIKTVLLMAAFLSLQALSDTRQVITCGGKYTDVGSGERVVVVAEILNEKVDVVFNARDGRFVRTFGSLDIRMNGNLATVRGVGLNFRFDGRALTDTDLNRFNGIVSLIGYAFGNNIPLTCGSRN